MTSFAIGLEDFSSLRQAVPDHVMIGAAIPELLLEDDRVSSLVGREFATITAENEMKPQSLQPRRGQFNWGPADRIIAFAEAHDIVVIGHTLVWHNQSPSWMFEDEQGKPLPREVALQNMKEHITTVMQRYKGKIKGWDVVNEAVPDGPGALRDTPALRAIGDDYVLKAFEFAHEADPDAELYYNDYNIELDYKRDRALALVKRIRDAGLRIDGVGIQGHYLLDQPSIEEIARGIKAYTDAGFRVMITELDVDPLPRQENVGADLSAVERDAADPYREGFPEPMQQKLAERYRSLFEVFLQNPRITRITFWGTTDAYTWLKNFPVRNRTNHPMLWDRKANPKPAYHAVRQTLLKYRDPNQQIVK
jgi:endo-1,4-beta-xylanase